MTAGRPAVPLERRLLEAKGDGRTAGHKSTKDIVQYEGAELVLEKPKDLKTRGSKEWDKIWEAGKTWLNVSQDYPWVEQICHCYDDIAAFRRQVKIDGLMCKGYAGQVVANPLLKEIRVAEATIRKNLAEIGFSPNARAKLGFAEIQVASGLANLQKKTSDRQAKASTVEEIPDAEVVPSIDEDWGTTTTTATQV